MITFITQFLPGPFYESSFCESFAWLVLAVLCWYYWRFGREFAQPCEHFPSRGVAEEDAAYMDMPEAPVPKPHPPTMPLRYGFILNPNSGKGSGEKEWASFQPFIGSMLAPGSWCVRRTGRAGDAQRFVCDLVDEGYNVIVSVGGDGTHNEVVNGYMTADGKAKGVKLGLLAVGTCGDLCRGLGYYKITKRQQVEMLRDGIHYEADIGCLLCTSMDSASVVKRYFINISSCGISGVVCSGVNSASTHMGGTLTFFYHAVKGTLFYRNTAMRYKCRLKQGGADAHMRGGGGAHVALQAPGEDSGWSAWMRADQVYQFCACNCRYNGGGMMLAPRASLFDGWLDVCLMRNVRLWDLPMTVKLYLGRHLFHSYFVKMMRVKEVYCEVDEPGAELLIEADGETPGKLPCQWSILPRAVDLICCQL